MDYKRMIDKELRALTMCKNNSRESAYSGGFSSHQNCCSLIGLSSAIGYYSYTHRCWASLEKNEQTLKEIYK
jgi:hypothetical protein